MSTGWLAGRTAVREAIHILAGAGYSTERIAKPVNFFDIIAWKPGHVLCVVVHSSKKSRLTTFSGYVRLAARSLSSGPCPGELQLWLCRSPGWDRWVISAGGAAPIEHWDPAVRGDAV
ncbi:hypothetical protein ACKUB1_09760 [Methanospirillum stamsii]|uniref:Uncharacterized protein n=1 Tax=Methanospirillum stamsii TaxID=1277351 RepID=A0A2V2N5H3_9EURY|nr:hypothetical protein [Methanospirillum stamsii]PWR75344.1 hypothetical protein DLD82_04205 [Methanospirillum stamsii]